MKNTSIKQKYSPKIASSVLAIGILFFLLSILSSCVNVKPYQKMYLNDYEMKLAGKKTDVFDNGIESYREGASGATGGKTGGGCGCN